MVRAIDQSAKILSEDLRELSISFTRRNHLQLQMFFLATYQADDLPHRVVGEHRFGIVVLQCWLWVIEGEHAISPRRQLVTELSVRGHSDLRVPPGTVRQRDAVHVGWGTIRHLTN